MRACDPGPDLLFELGTEELPPTALKTLIKALAEGFSTGLKANGLDFNAIRSFGTPRRLAVWVQSCSIRQPDQCTQRLGPPLADAIDHNGKPTLTAKGFARSCGTCVEKLEQLDTKKGPRLVFNNRQPGKNAIDLLPEIAQQALGQLPIPRRMRWGNLATAFIRPVHWLVFIHGKTIVPCELMGVRADNKSYGHRFHHPGPIEINNPGQYIEKLKSAKVIVDFTHRRERICQQVNEQASQLGGQVNVDDTLLDEVCALVEWPVPISACFEEKYLTIPADILVYTMKTHQKYFPIRKNTRLSNHFIAIANIESTRPELIRNGNERVIRPRLADAMFFWEQDGKRPLESYLVDLKTTVFHKKLGSLYDKSERVAHLSATIATWINGDVELAQRAAWLSRCDLMTRTVSELAQMQGIMGRYQALKEGEPAELATALEEFYLPRFSGDRLPQTPTGIAISLAEKIDTLVSVFGVGIRPTGDKDPYHLRRLALGALRILKEHQLNIQLHPLLTKASQALNDRIEDQSAVDSVYDFMWQRLKGIYTDADISTTLFQTTTKSDCIADFDQRLQALAHFQHLPKAKILALANKRINQILKKSANLIWPEPNPDLFQQPEEQALYEALKHLKKTIEPLLIAQDYSKVLIELSALSQPVDGFFNAVMVMVDDQQIRNNRLALLHWVQQVFIQVGDLSKLQ